jgi:hypothetical protein
VVGCALLASIAAAAPVDPVVSAAADLAPAPPAVIVLEAHVGERTSGAAIATVRDELARHGFATRPMDIVQQLGGRAPQPGVLDPDQTSADILALCTQGYEAFTRAQYRDASATLTRAIELIRRNPDRLALDTANARVTFRAFLGLALSQAKLGAAADSAQTMTELLRAFSTRTVDRAEYGPEAEKAYRDAQRQAEALGRGQLSIHVDLDSAMVFVNGELRGTGSVSLAGLIPGVYHVYVCVPGSGGRQYQVAVRAEHRTALGIEWQVDSALTVSAAFVGFVFASRVEADRLPVYAGSLARRWDRERIAILDAAQVEGQPAVRATLYGRDGHVVRTAWTPADGDDGALRALARFLADGAPSSELRGARRELVPDERVASSEKPGHAAVPAWPFVATGVTAIGVGVALWLVDQNYGYTDSRGVRPTYYRDTAPWGVGVGITGALSLGFGVWWWRRHRVPPLSVSATGSRISLAFERSF